MTEADLISYLLTDTAILSLIGTSSSPIVARIYPDTVKEGDTGADGPILVYSLIDGDDPECLDGEPSLATDFWQVSAYALKSKDANALRKAVRDRMRGVGGLNFQKNSLNGRRDGYESETLFYRRDIDFSISY